MKSWKKPTPEQIEKAVAFLAHGEQHRYFFDRLENPEWIDPLKAKGFFSAPPPPIHDEVKGTVAFPPWPESRYLARMAKYSPEAVLKVILEMPESQNVHVHVDLAEAALDMPPALAAQTVPKAITWIRVPFQLLLVPQRLGDLLSHLAKGGLPDVAMDLAKTLLGVRPDPRVNQEALEENRFLFPEPQPFFDLWNYERIMKKNVPDLTAAVGEPVLALLSDFLEEAVRMSRRPDEEPGPEDYSQIWRPAIDRGQSTDHDVRGVLVSAVRDTAESLCEQDRSRIDRVVRTLEARPFRVFHRLALHILRLFADAAPDLVAERLGNPERFDLPDFRREYNLLATERFRSLDQEHQAKILSWIEKGLDPEFVKARLTNFTGRPVTDGEAALYIKQWQRDRLAPIAADAPENWKKRFEDLVQERGPARDPASVRTITAGFGPKSPLSSDDLRKMTIAQLLDYLDKWVPTGELTGESIEGLGRDVAALAASEPDRFSAEAERFKGSDPTYVRALVQGLWGPVKEKRTISWGPFLGLCEWVMEQPREIAGRKGGILDRDPDWGWTRNAVAKMLSEGFDHDSIPFDLRDRTWRILKSLTEDPMPTTQDDEGYGKNMDPATYSINTTRGEAMHAVVRYALWVGRHLENQPREKAPAGIGFDEMPEVRSILDKHLDPSQEPSVAIRAVYGQRFVTLYFLDPIWAKANINRVFPGDDASKALRDAAWGTYVIFCQPYNEVFDALLEEYRRAIEAIGTPSQNWRHLGNPDSRLAEHLMIEYWWGHIDWTRPEGLMSRFYAKADPALRGWALEFVGRSLREESARIDVNLLERLKSLWTNRLESGRAAGKGSKDSQELASFAWWFVSKRFDDEWAVDQLREALQIAGKIDFDFLVVERLAELSPQMPAKTVECLSMIVEGDKEGWDILGWREHARTILFTAINSQDVGARDAAIDLVQRLGRRGHLEYRDLLPRAAHE